MESEPNLTTFDLNVYFVVPKKYKNEEECSTEMCEAYNKCIEYDIHPDWISEKQCLKLEKYNRKDVFIMEIFEGEAFEKLQTFKCTIIGPRCLLSCFLSGESIPEGSTPVFNTAMRGCVVCPSGFSGSQKSDIQRMVEYMGGIFTKQLRGSVTHLVTDIVISAKYERAVDMGIKVMTIHWVRSVWDTNLAETIPAKDQVFDKYKCPIFLNLVVTSTNLSKRQKDEIKKLLVENGGEFMGVLDGTKIKMVITSESCASSEKLKYAMHNDIPCLKVQWVYDSVEAGYALPFKNYMIKSTKASSTPEKSTVQDSLNFSTISMIPGDSRHVYVDETLAGSTMSSTMMNSTLLSGNLPVIPTATYITVMERLNINDAKKAGPFLDGCNIYLTGFSSNYRDKLNRILNVGSATRLDEISDALTHVIVGDPTKATQDLRVIKSKNLYPYILKVEWLEESMKMKAPAAEDNFLIDMKDNKNQAAPEPPSPLSKKNLQLLQRPKIPAAPLFDESVKKPVDDEHSEIVQQYLQNTVSEPDTTLREILKLPSSNLGNDTTSLKDQTAGERWENSKRITRPSISSESRDDSAIPISQESFVSQKILQGLIFIVTGFNDAEYAQIVAQIHGLGGKIVGRNYTGIPDYGIVPKLGAEMRHTVGEIVSNLFIEDCIDNEKLVEVSYYHKPIIIPPAIKPLANCVIGMSTYSGVERTYLSSLSEELGARYQDTFARKTNLQKNTVSSTHLICPLPQGDKYNAAVKWRLPAVTAEWLLQCASEMKLVDETLFLVGETMAPERPDTTTTNDENNENKTMKPPTEPTPKRSVFVGPNETPIVNKRLNNLINDKTPQEILSPYHVSTPDTPYGQFFKENPSPRTRKGWLKWINHFPDMPVDEPTPKRRRSTPLSEVKRIAWDFVTGRLDEKEADESEDNDKSVKNQKVDECSRRKLSFSEDSPTKTPKNPAINRQIAQLDELLQKASNTPEPRQSLSGENANPYHLESTGPPRWSSVKESQPDSVGWEDPVKRIPPSRRSIINEEPVDLETVDDDDDFEVIPIEDKEEELKLKFMFSGIKDKAAVEKMLKELGGEVSCESAYDPSSTHLLCMKPARNEKVLSSIAAGKWVLHSSYVEACSKENKFLNEEEYELGNPKSKGIIPDPNSEGERMIMNAAYRWRLKLLKDPGGAFKDMVALLITPKEKREQFERLIHAGGGIVVEAKPPYDGSPRGKKITHCFIQLKQIDQQVDWAMMASKGIMCFPPQYLNDHLMAENPLNQRECVLPEFQKYLALMPK